MHATPAKKNILRRLVLWAGCLLVAWLVLCGCANALVNRLMVFPQQLPADWVPPQGREVMFESDGAELCGVLLESTSPRGVVVYSHGNAGSLDDWIWVGAELRDRLNVTVFVWDYPGFGKSGGRPTPARLLSAGTNAVAAAVAATGIPPQDMVFMGRSLGGAVAASAACHLGPRALVIDSSFSSLRDMAARAVFFLPWSWLLDEPMDSEAAVAAYKGPVFVAHGDGDRTIPFRFGRRLYAAASGPKFFFRIAGGDHNDPMPENCFKALEEFLGGENVLKE